MKQSGNLTNFISNKKVCKLSDKGIMEGFVTYENKNLRPFKKTKQTGLEFQQNLS